MTETVMTEQVMPNNWEKVGYSLAGLVAGNLVEIAVLFLAKLIQVSCGLQLFHFLNADTYRVLGWLVLCIAIVSLAGWLFVGLPAVLLMPARWLYGFPLGIIALVGAILGPLALGIGFLCCGERITSIDQITGSGDFLIPAAIISASALATVAELVRKKNGAREGRRPFLQRANV